MLGKHLKIETDPIEQNDLPLKLNKNGHLSSKGHTYDKSQTGEVGEMAQSVKCLAPKDGEQSSLAPL